MLDIATIRQVIDNLSRRELHPTHPLVLSLEKLKTQLTEALGAGKTDFDAIYNDWKKSQTTETLETTRANLAVQNVFTVLEHTIYATLTSRIHRVTRLANAAVTNTLTSVSPSLESDKYPDILCSSLKQPLLQDIPPSWLT